MPEHIPVGYKFPAVFFLLTSFTAYLVFTSSPSNDEMADWKNASSVYDFSVNDINGSPIPMDKYKGNVLLIVNVASQCGLTATNYAELVDLDNKFKEKGLKILAFPCNQFGGQEPGNPEEIVCFAKNKNAKFDFFEKIDVNGDNAHPLWKYLKDKQGGTLGSFIKWNFTKFIVDKNGQVVSRHGPNTNPSKLEKEIENSLALVPVIEKHANLFRSIMNFLRGKP